MATGAAAALTALCTFLVVSASVAQDDDPANDATLTVGQCIENSIDASLEPFEETLVREGTIKEGLLQTRVTKGMCADMLERTPGDTPVRKLLAAQNYVQEIELIEGAMQKGASEDDTEETGRRSPGGDSLDLTLAAAQTAGEATEQQATPPDDGSASPTASPSASPSASPTASPSVSPSLSPGDGGGGGDDGSGGDGGSDDDDEPLPGAGDEAGVEPEEMQAAAISSMVRGDSDASIEERLDAGTDAGVKAGASRPEAAAGTRCSLEVEFLDDYVQRLLPGTYDLTPDAIPKEIRYGTTRRIALSITPATREVFEKIKQQHEAVAEASESDVECVSVTGQMKATLGSLDDLDISSRDENVKALYADQSTVWEWSVTGKPEGRKSLYLDLSYAITPPGEVPTFRSHEPPPLEGAITVKATPLQNVSGFVGGDWLSFSEFTIALVTSIIAPALFYLWRQHRKQLSSEPGDQQQNEPGDEGPA